MTGKSSKTLFISDVHLEEKRPDIAQQFIKLIENSDRRFIDAIYILGDLFEAWIGDDDVTSFHEEIIQTLYRATESGLPIYFCHGNRDFLIGKTFLKKTGCILLAEEEKIMLYGTPVLLMHGDTLCTLDIPYQRWRKITHQSKLVKTFFLCLPLKLRKLIANKLRNKSSAYTQSTPMNLMDVTPSTVDYVMQHHQVQHLIHGHTHRPAIHQFITKNNVPMKRIVLGAWHSRGNMLVWYQSGITELIEL